MKSSDIAYTISPIGPIGKANEGRKLVQVCAAAETSLYITKCYRSRAEKKKGKRKLYGVAWQQKQGSSGNKRRYRVLE